MHKKKSSPVPEIPGISGVWNTRYFRDYCGKPELFLGAMYSAPKTEKTIKLFLATGVKSSLCGGVSILDKDLLHFCDGSINAEQFLRFYRNTWCLQDHVFPRDIQAFFSQQDNAKPDSAHITKAWLRRRKEGTGDHRLLHTLTHVCRKHGTK